MAGGLLNLIALGNQNIILNGNPTKSFFKTRYVKYTNFGLQRFRVDQQGQTALSLAQETIYTFKIPRYGDLLMDSFLVITLPTIWSPILQYFNSNTNKTEFRPYEFQWIKNIGTQIIKQISINIGGRLIQQFSGHFIQNIVERDFDANKKAIFNLMTGNVAELNNPANFSNRKNNYPNAYKLDNADTTNTVEPSIYSNQLFIPINTWFSMTSTMAIPLICLQYAELDIVFNLRPIYELFTIKNVLYDISGQSGITTYDDVPRIQPAQNMSEVYAWHRFVQPPPYRDISCQVTNGVLTALISYPNQIPNLTPQTDIHLITTQCFLDNEERILFAGHEQTYLFKMIYEYDYQRITKESKVIVESNGLISSWMWFMQRDDVKKRNEWSNYTNWAYEDVFPTNLLKLTTKTNNTNNINPVYYSLHDIYGIGDLSKNIYITGNSPDVYHQQNNRLILKDFAVLCDGKYRENSLPAGVYNRIEKYSRSKGDSKEGLYCYNFAFDTDPYKYQPTGAFNTNKFKTIEFEYNNYANPPIDLSAVNFQVICDPVTNQVIAVSKDPTSIYSYNYNLHIYEERYNVLIFQSGVAELLYSR